jgi:DNA polymerase III alpha subunit (gram-positive type)
MFIEWIKRNFGKLSIVFVSHNNKFEKTILDLEMQRIKCYEHHDWKFACSMKLLQNLYPEMKSHALEDLCSKFEVINEFQHHGKEDVQATFELLEKVAKEKKIECVGIFD